MFDSVLNTPLVFYELLLVDFCDIRFWGISYQRKKWGPEKKWFSKGWFYYAFSGKHICKMPESFLSVTHKRSNFGYKTPNFLIMAWIKTNWKSLKNRDALVVCLINLYLCLEKCQKKICLDCNFAGLSTLTSLWLIISH